MPLHSDAPVRTNRKRDVAQLVCSSQLDEAPRLWNPFT